MVESIGEQLDQQQPGAAARAKEAARKRKAAKEESGVVQDRPIDSAYLIPLDRIQAKEQPRKTFNQQKHNELVQSIRSLRNSGGGVMGTGILQPISLRKDVHKEGFYILVAGERRYRASKEAEVTLIPAIVESMTADDAYISAITENLQREELLPIEEAQAYQHILTTRSIPQTTLAKLLGVSNGYLTNRLGLLKKGEDVREMVSLRGDTISVAPLIDGVVSEADRANLIRQVVEENAPVAEIKKQVAAIAKSGGTRNLIIGRPSEAAKLPPFDYLSRATQAASDVNSIVVALLEVPAPSHKRRELINQANETIRLCEELKRVLGAD